MSYEVKHQYVYCTHEAHEEPPWLGKSWSGGEEFSTAAGNIALVLPFPTNLLFVLLFCFSLQNLLFLSVCLLTFNLFEFTCNDSRLTFLLLFAPCTTVLCRLSHSPFLQCSSFLQVRAKGTQLHWLRAGVGAWLNPSFPRRNMGRGYRGDQGQMGVSRANSSRDLLLRASSGKSELFRRVVYTTF